MILVAAVTLLSLLDRVSAERSAEVPLEVTVAWSRAPHSVSFVAGRDPSASARLGCIMPSPFGTQCTVHLSVALAACALDRACTAVICPDQTPYLRGNEKKHIEGPICQLRSHEDYDERSHRMCRPGGCTRWSIHTTEFRPSSEFARLIQTPFDRVRAVITLPKKLLEYECEARRHNGVAMVRADAGAAAGDHPCSWCLDMGPLRGARFVEAVSRGDRTDVCVFEAA